MFVVQKVIFLKQNVKKIFVCGHHPLGGGNESNIDTCQVNQEFAMFPFAVPRV